MTPIVFGKPKSNIKGLVSHACYRTKQSVAHIGVTGRKECDLIKLSVTLYCPWCEPNQRHHEQKRNRVLVVFRLIWEPTEHGEKTSRICPRRVEGDLDPTVTPFKYKFGGFLNLWSRDKSHSSVEKCSATKNFVSLLLCFGLWFSRGNVTALWHAVAGPYDGTMSGP